jgi:SAM-dependent methyltransferase
MANRPVDPPNHDLQTVAAPIAGDWAHHSYYEQAECKEWLDGFWGPTAVFLPRFRRLDLTCAVELACGHGRHAAQIVDQCGKLVLLDVNETNIAFCRNRFQRQGTVECYVINGFSLAPIEADSVTALFTYDAMVHFEPEIVLAYIRDTARVLKAGGRALFHHSAYAGQPGSHYSERPYYRNFMTPDLVRHVAIRSGFEMLDQYVFSWGPEAPNTECITLLEKRRVG